MKNQHTQTCVLAFFWMANFLFSSLGSAQTICPGITNTGPITPCLLKDGCDPTVTSVGDPYIYEGECSIGLDRYLARSADVGKLADFNFFDHFYEPNSSNPLKECEKPHNKIANTDYCPEVYCKMIKTLVDMDIQFVQRAYWGAYGHEHQFYPGEGYYELGKQLIRDINYAYDCAGKRRPIIQGTAMDNIDPQNFKKAVEYDDNGVDRNIPKCVIEKYFEEFPDELDEIDPDSNPDYPFTYREYYFQGHDIRTDLFFRKERIGIDGPGDNGTTAFYPKIEKIEFRMFLLYQAWTQIDMGYTALHMGIYYSYAASEAPSYDKLYGVTKAIRNYAAQKGSFVLLSGEPPKGPSAKHGDEFIFDFDSRAMRPREIARDQDGNEISGDGIDCNQSIDPAIISAVNASPCGGYDLKAVVDPCTINSFGGSTGGMSPQGCYVSQQPYTVHFDGFHAPTNPGQPSNGPDGLTYGYHDHQWFSQLPEDCQRWWFDYFYCDRRNYHDGNGFIVIPGIILYDADLNDAHDDGAEQLISDRDAFVQGLIGSTLRPKMPVMVIEEETSYPYGCANECNGQVAPPGKRWLVGKRCYIIRIDSTDCSSKYSIHVRDPHGHWLPQVLGDTYHLCPEIEGEYEIRIRQDNLGLPASTYGTREIIAHPPLTPTVCFHLINYYECRKHYVTATCDETDAHKRTFEFSIESDSTDEIIRSVRPVENYVVIKSTQQITPQKLNGLIEVRDTNVTQMELLVDVERIGVTSTDYTTTQLPDCTQGSVISRNAQGLLPSVEKSVLIFPNPTEQYLNVQYLSNAEQDINLLIYNSLGQVQYVDQLKVATGKNLWEINTAAFQTGNYMLVMTGDHLYECKKFVKKDN